MNHFFPSPKALYGLSTVVVVSVRWGEVTGVVARLRSFSSRSKFSSTAAKSVIGTRDTCSLSPSFAPSALSLVI